MSVILKKRASLLNRALSDIFLHERHRLLNNTLISVVEVLLNHNMGIAKVYISKLVPSKNDILPLLKTHTGVIKKILGKKIGGKIRRIPELHFYMDTTLDSEYNLNKILDEISDKGL